MLNKRRREGGKKGGREKRKIPCRNFPKGQGPNKLATGGKLLKV